MGFQDLSEFFKPGLQLPIRGKTYTIPAVNAADGLRLRLLFSDPTVSLTDEGELKEIMTLLGAEWVSKVETVNLTDPNTGVLMIDDETGKVMTAEVDRGSYQGGVYQEMADDGLSWDEIMHAGRTAMLNAGMGRTVAEVHWETGLADAASGNPLPPKPGASEQPVEFPNRATKRAAKKTAPKKAAAKKATSSKAATGSSTRARKRTAKTTRAAGDYDPVTGMRDWYAQSATTTAAPAEARVTWPEILEQWVSVTHDLHEVYGIDVESGILRERTWKWFEDKITDLLLRGPRLSVWMNVKTRIVQEPRS
ncbi:tail assembly chaperone [Gordonia phage MichaelScott]|uniref:Tail assembly chaperone n=2 Tax=Beenievirus TaxID=3044673 RepID=A0A2K9VH90_9CAUD|nr:tail assembly chaperone [Gordonia phage Beenie]YP_010654567.1 tail assembly chaperone [Gordonia phage MichaelScott]AUV61581.1 tail assembly chaperone [Gordonia phage Beenie]QOC56258.1 tail assembly chaperone [Gordonia phage MichaelScott]UTN93529.1 tail assembly chaperone [Gordonia phage Oregano]